MTLSANRRLALFAGAAAMATVAGVAVGLRRHADSGFSEQAVQALWSAEFDAVAGGTLALSALKGSPLVLNFWATWCPPCVEEMPLIDAFYRENQSKGWQVIGLAIDQPSRVRSFLAQSSVSYPIGLAGMNGSEFGKILGNSDGSLPFTVVFDAQGRLTFRKLGKLTPEEVKNWAL
jgi:thiol-disulfide isomerase/thioredoxin